MTNLSLPFARGSDTSKAAAESMEKPSCAIREAVFQTIKAAGNGGVTCDALEAWLGLKHQTCSARVNELMRADRIVDVGLRRKTRSGRQAVAWVAR